MKYNEETQWVNKSLSNMEHQGISKHNNRLWRITKDMCLKLSFENVILSPLQNISLENCKRRKVEQIFLDPPSLKRKFPCKQERAAASNPTFYQFAS